MTLTNVESILYEWAGELIKDAQDNLNKSASVASGKQASTMKILPIKFAGSVYTLKISLEDYYDFINKGVAVQKTKETAHTVLKVNTLVRLWPYKYLGGCGKEQIR